MTPRKNLELKSKAAALTTELGEWTKVAAAGQRFEKHHSQVARLSVQLGAAVAELLCEIDKPNKATVAEEIEDRILDLHRVWNFFRGKLVLRSFDHFRDYLAIADEFAYACYKPVIDSKGDTFREPPLTFFNEESSPFAMARNRSYSFAIPGASLTNEAASALVKSLPVPVIGIPWFQQGHLPDLAIVAHEAGHHVEDDLALAGTLDVALQNANLEPGRRVAWLSWRGEVFADVYATLALGRAFALALLDFLTSSEARAMAAGVIGGPPWGDYPTPALRIAITREVLRELKTLDQKTKDLLAPVAQHAMSHFDADCSAVVKAFLDTAQPGGKKLAQLLRPLSELNASDAAGKALNEGTIEATDPRELVAAAVLAWTRDAKTFHETAQAKLADRIRASIVPGTRGIPMVEQQEKSAAKSRPADLAVGRSLLVALRGADDRSPSDG
jgi:hypothetical protein